MPRQINHEQRASLVQTALVSTVLLVSLLLLGFVLAYWTWIWLAPRTEPRLDVAAEGEVQLAAANTLFGTVVRNRNSAAPTGIAIKLQGVMAAPAGNPLGQRVYAVVLLDGKQNLAVHVGEDIAPGIRLAEVYPDHVILERNGARESLAWPEKKEPTTPATPATPGANGPLVGK